MNIRNCQANANSNPDAEKLGYEVRFILMIKESTILI